MKEFLANAQAARQGVKTHEGMRQMADSAKDATRMGVDGSGKLYVTAAFCLHYMRSNRWQ